MFGYVDQNYDPFFLDPQVPEVASISTTSSTISAAAPKAISQEKYLLVYVALGEAVDALVETVESFKEASISSDYLEELGKCMTTPRKAAGSAQEQARAEDVTFQATESQLDYFEFLQQTHKDENTQKYFIGQRQPPNVDLPTIVQFEEPGLSQENAFSLQDFLPKPEPYCLKDVAAQTAQLQQESSTVPEEEKLSASSTQSSSSLHSRNLFYFLDSDSQGTLRD